MYDLVLPFIGNISIWPYVIGAIVILLIWDYVPTLLKLVITGAWKLARKAGSAVAAGAVEVARDVKDDVVNAVNQESSKPDAKIAPLPALQKLTEYAVFEASPEVLAKVTALYGDVQKQLRESK
jgi:hypothetical protein